MVGPDPPYAREPLYLVGDSFAQFGAGHQPTRMRNRENHPNRRTNPEGWDPPKTAIIDV